MESDLKFLVRFFLVRKKNLDLHMLSFKRITRYNKKIDKKKKSEILIWTQLFLIKAFWRSELWYSV